MAAFQRSDAISVYTTNEFTPATNVLLERALALHAALLVKLDWCSPRCCPFMNALSSKSARSREEPCDQAIGVELFTTRIKPKCNQELATSKGIKCTAPQLERQRKQTSSEPSLSDSQSAVEVRHTLQHFPKHHLTQNTRKANQAPSDRDLRTTHRQLQRYLRPCSSQVKDTHQPHTNYKRQRWRAHSKQAERDD